MLKTLLMAAAGLAVTASVASADTNPTTIVLVHGAFADGSSWDKVAPALESKGYHVVAVYDPMSSLADDVAATKRVIEAQKGPVVLVGHSYGGAVITEAGNDPKVQALVYVAAFAPDAGESINGLGKGQPPPPWVTKLVVDSAGFASLPTDVVLSDFAQDLKPADAKLVAYKQGPIAARCFDDKIKTAAWRTKSSWFVIPGSDHMIDPKAQGFMAKRAGSKVTSVKGASHVVMLSKSADVVSTILAAAKTVK
ncbi:MAG TPA: alpha/beta hydrolase [Kofleriaceae bacterium]|jgi:pimeloyl-ACP methyl ester carboxylesterase